MLLLENHVKLLQGYLQMMPGMGTSRLPLIKYALKCSLLLVFAEVHTQPGDMGLRVP